ncbi:MAG: pitrilysin family protein [bacterium]
MYKIATYKNGLKVLTAPVSGSKTVTVLVAIGTGSKYENKENNGVSHFLEHMFFKGTKKFATPLSLASAMDVTGGEYNAFTGKEMTAYYMKVDAKKADRALELISDMLVNSKFAEAEFERERGVIIEEINMYEDNPMMYVEDLFEQCLYGDTAAGWDTAGDKENIKKMKRSDLVDYFTSQYQLHNTLICVAGALPSGLEARINKYFGNYAKNKKPIDFIDKQSVFVEQDKAAVKLKYKKTDQAHLSLGVPTFATGDKRETIIKIISVILGGSMSSRLFTELREKRGMAYYVHTQAEGYTDAGYLTTQAGVPVDKVDEAIECILLEYKKISSVLLKKEELARIKEMLNGKIVMKLEGSDDVANWYARQAILSITQAREQGKGKIIMEPKTFLAQLNKITPEDIRSVAKEIFKAEKLNLAIIGPYEDYEKFENLLKL